MALNMSSMMRPARSPLDLAQSFTSSITQKDPSLPADTEMFNLAGDYGNAFFESFHDNNVFSQYLFNYWQYTDYYGTWPGQPIANVPKSLYDKKVQSDWTQKWFEFGTLNLPNAAYANAAHKNGAKSIAMIFYSDNDRGEQTYKDLLEGKRADGTYPVADNYIDDGTSNDGWKGFASQIAECSVVGGSMFSTSFNTGHGLEWRDGGERTSDQQWGNINLQDILPTWQWWIDADSDPLQADFDYGKDYEAVPRFKYTKVGGYEGGDSLVLSGKLSNDNTIRLYKTDLDVAAGSKIDLTYNKLNSDDSKLQLGLILADDPETVVPVDVTDGSAGNGWKTASVDLSQYAGKKIATLGLIVKWNLADYSTIKNYLLYLDNTFLGGRYDDTLYVKHLPAKTGTLKLYAVGADGSRSLAPEAPLNEAAAVSDVKVEPGKDGNVKVSWTNPQVSGEKTVTVKSDTGSWRYAAKPYSQTVKVAADKSKVTIANAPVDSSRYVVNVDNAGGTTATATGAFADAAIEPYPACSVIWNGDNVTLARPETQDWRYLYMTEKWIGENGKQQQENQLGASYTYSQNTPPITGIIRGRTTPASYTRSIPRQS